MSGKTIVIGAPYEDSNAIDVGGNQLNFNAQNSGAAYVFAPSGPSGPWTQQAYVKASNTGLSDLFGYSVALSVDTMIVGATHEDSTPNNSSTDSGAAYVLARTYPPVTWTQPVYHKAGNTGQHDHFGWSVGASSFKVIVGAPHEDSITTGVNSIPDELAPQAGAAYISFDPTKALVITSDDPLEPKVGQTFSYLIPASDDAKSFGATDLPAGLSLDPMTGVISGTPTTVGNYTVTLSASNDNGTANQTLILDVKLPKAPAITSMPTTTATVDQPCFHYITASDEPKSFSATDLPAGLSLDPKTGEISGTPTSAGTYMITLSASNEIGAGSQTFTITVLPYIPVIMSPDTVTVTVGQPLSHTITADNAPTFYAAANLPPGLSLNAVTGEISGKPTTVGTYTIMLSSSNDKGTGSQTLTLSVTLPPEIRITYYVDLPGFVLSVQGEENQEYGVEYTTDFQQWIPFESKILGETDLFMVDPRAMESPYRFYRVIRR